MNTTNKDAHKASQNKKGKDTSTEVSDVAKREEAVLAFWQEHDIFKKSIEKKSPKGDFVFYDGPPFATGLPHYGHILAGTIKDAIPRFRTMQGYRVRRVWGWDCHGLPLENQIEKKLGLATKRDIEEYGIQNFNEAARDAVLEYADDWRRIVPRMGRFVDMEHDYKTMDSDYTESVWWVFRQLHEKGLVYEGFKSMHLCPRCGTTLSNFEVNQGYKDIKDISVYVKLHLKPKQKFGPKYETKDSAYLIVWTTTPWTLPGNMAAAVHKDATYAAVRIDGVQELLILSKDSMKRVLEGHEVEVVHDDIQGSDLVGLEYTPPFDYWKKQEFAGKENAWKIYHADYVEIGDEGTGAVHLAPAYGEEDMELAKREGVPIVHHVDEEGHFKDFVTDFKGLLVKPKDDDDAEVSHLDTDIEIVKALKENGRLFKKENITHSYPHCWRCDTPLLNYATTSWFVEVTKLTDTLVSENKNVKWVPEHVGKNRFGRWLEGARDWAISRQRYWGAPLPIWRNPETKAYKVFGSLTDLREHTPKSNNRYYLMRHGESEGNVAGVSSGDVTKKDRLTETGKAQVEDTAGALKEKGVDLIIASPFLRTKESAELVAREIGYDPKDIVFDERIGEIQFGEMEGESHHVYHNFLNSGAKWCDCAPVDGESWYDVKRRVGEFLYDIEEKYKDKNILIVSHNSPLRMLGAINDGLSLHGTDFDHDEDGKRYDNAEVRELPFVPMPHNDEYELDFHRPYIDVFHVVDEDGTKLERVPDVFDCWFESGSMPYAQHHYPFENKDVFEKELFPANFIAEGLDQTRGWFYSLIVLGTALFGESPYQNVIVNGTVLAEDGRKMSKRLQNYPDPMKIADTLGVDAMRFYLLSSPVMRAEDFNFSESGVQELQRKNIGRLHNVLAMYELYATNETVCTSDSGHVLDRWIVARLNELIRESTDGYEKYELDRATRPITDFIDDLSVWYLRRSRDRIKSDDAKDKEAALGTLRYVLRELSLVMAPSMPFYAEYLWGRVKNENDEESVHLASWPEFGEANNRLITEMRLARDFVSIALEIRAKSGVKVRQPLLTLKIGGKKFEEESLYDIIAEEVNVKKVEISDQTELDTTITPELKAEGDAREFMRQVQDMRKKAGLAPSDRITITVQASGEGEEVLKQFESDIARTVGADSIAYGRIEGTEVVAGDHSFTVDIEKV